MASDLARILGIDPEDFDWQDLALCRGFDREMFYDDYESDDNVARQADEACLSCPVMAQCLEWGIDNQEWGTWGGIYLVNGKPDMNKNSHKTQEVWEEIKEKIGDAVL